MPNLVSAAAPQAPDVTPQAPAPAPDADAAAPAPAAPSLPPSLTKIPAIQGLMAGAPVAFSARISEFKDTPVGKDIIKHAETLKAAGFGFYRSVQGDLAVLYNRFHVHGSDLQQADKAGKLQVLAPPFEQVDHALSKMGGKHMLGKTVPQGFAAPSPQAAPQAGAQDAGPQPPAQATTNAGGASAALQKRLMAARLSNMAPGAPTSGPAPGGGRLLQSILKPVI